MEAYDGSSEDRMSTCTAACEHALQCSERRLCITEDTVNHYSSRYTSISSLPCTLKPTSEVALLATTRFPSLSRLQHVWPSQSNRVCKIRPHSSRGASGWLQVPAHVPKHEPSMLAAGNLLATTSGDLVYLDFSMISDAPEYARYAIIAHVVNLVSYKFLPMCQSMSLVCFLQATS